MSQCTYKPAVAWQIAILLAVLNVINFLDKVVIGLVAVPMMKELKLSPSEFGVIAGSFFWLFAIAGILGGFLADRLNTKWLIAGGALLWAVLQIPMALTASVGAIIACRFLLGIAEGPNWPMSIHALYKWFPNEKRSLPVAALGMGGSVGLMTAGLIMPSVSATWGWRANFVLLSIVGVVWLVFWVLFSKEGTLEEAQSLSDSKRIPYRHLLLDRTVIAVIFTHFACFWSIALMVTWTAIFFQKGLGYDGITAGRLFSLSILLTAICGWGAAWLSQRLMQRKVPSRIARGILTAITTLVAAACFASILIPGLPAVLYVLALGVGGGLATAVLYTGPPMFAEIIPNSQRGSMLAIDNSVASTAGMIAPIVTGWLVQHAGGGAYSGYSIAFSLTGAFLLVAGIVSWAFLNPERSSQALLGAAPVPAE